MSQTTDRSPTFIAWEDPSTELAELPAATEPDLPACPELDDELDDELEDRADSVLQFVEDTMKLAREMTAAAIAADDAPPALKAFARAARALAKTALALHLIGLKEVVFPHKLTQAAAEEKLGKYIDHAGAGEPLWVMVYDLTNSSIAKRFVNARRRDADVRVILCATQLDPAVIAFLRRGKVEVRVATMVGGNLFHRKVQIAGVILVGGSANLSGAVASRNVEGILDYVGAMDPLLSADLCLQPGCMRARSYDHRTTRSHNPNAYCEIHRNTRNQCAKSNYQRRIDLDEERVFATSRQGVHQQIRFAEMPVPNLGEQQREKCQRKKCQDLQGFSQKRIKTTRLCDACNEVEQEAQRKRRRLARVAATAAPT